jgi:ATP-binding cassette subfamily B protein
LTRAEFCWPVSRAEEGIELLARAAGYSTRPAQPRSAPAAGGERVIRAASSLGLELEPVDTSFGEVGAFLRTAGPAIVRIDDSAMVLLVKRRGRRALVVCPDHRIVKVPILLLERALVESTASPLIADAERLVQQTGIRSSRRARVARALVDFQLRSRRLEAGWLLRMPAGAGFGRQLVAAGARRQLILLAAAHAAQYASLLLAWWLLGRAALRGHLDAGWLGAWALALATLVCLQLAALWLQGTLAIRVGALLKRRLLRGAFQLETEEIRTEGAGRLLGRVMEAEAVGSLAISGGFLALLATMEIGLAALVLTFVSSFLTLLLVAWIGVAAVLTIVYLGRRSAWVALRVALTHDLIERMVGHRTRVAQEPPQRRHDGEDEALERYVRGSERMDRAGVWLLAAIPRGWIVIGLAGLAPLFVAGSSPAVVAVALGGILLGYRALDRLTMGLWSLADAVIAWRQVAPMFRAAGRSTLDALPAVTADRGGSGSAPILEATDLRFAHPGRGEPVLRGCTVAMTARDRVILLGPSGAGKSTLASLLAGLRRPQSGLVLLDGLDRHTLGLSGWRRRVVLVPQFHENHLLLGSVAFNALMGVDWPPSEQESARAEQVLRELGLGDTLDRMPSGLLQTVGETGWQLSHGERSRLFLARALLQEPDVLVLDESFAQLDPENMKLALDAVTSRAAAVLLIAHP